MEKNNKNRWVVIAVVAAVVAALTTVVVLVLRARAKKKAAWYDQEALDCDLDDCECFVFDDEDVIDEPAIEE